jgi:hypothetical protein
MLYMCATGTEQDQFSFPITWIVLLGLDLFIVPKPQEIVVVDL